MQEYDKTFIDFVQSKFMTVTSWLCLVNGWVFKSMEDTDKNLDSLVQKWALVILEGIELC